MSAVEDYDHFVLSLFDGTSAKAPSSMVRSVLSRGITPSIGEDGKWKIGGVDTGVYAEGKTPEFRKTGSGVEFKYTTDDDTAWKMLVSYDELRLKYEYLTPEQIASLKLKYEDLTPEDIAELQRPANDMIAVLEATEKEVSQAESARVSAEEGRVSAELQRSDAEAGREEAERQRAEAELLRAESELRREASESQRVSSEQERVTAEEGRAAAESERTASEQRRQEDYENMKESLLTSQMILVMSESDYEDAVNSGTVDDTKLYFAYEED